MNVSGSRRAWLVAIMCIMIGASACSDSGEANSSSSNSPVQDDSTSEQSPPEVVIKGIAFVPPDIAVAVGAEVKWTNQDAVDHTVTSGVQREQGVPGVEEDKAAQPDGRFDSNLPEEGDTFAFTFDEPGTYTYYCDVHASMTGEITVE
ncbi:MAG: cupredoxin domain-containing protein [Actinomycetota bacterium]